MKSKQRDSDKTDKITNRDHWETVTIVDPEIERLRRLHPDELKNKWM